MNKIKDRVLSETELILKTKKTIREIAKELKISKSKAFNLKKSALEFLKKELEHIDRG